MSKPRKSASGQDYKVGYARPPVEHRFKKGNAGNKKGRKKKELQTVGERFSQALNRELTLPDGRKITTLDAIIHAQAAKAVKGDHRAAKFLIDNDERYRASAAQAIDWTTVEESDRQIITAYFDDYASDLAAGADPGGPPSDREPRRP